MAEIALRAARVGEAPDLTALARRSKAHWGYDTAFMACCAAELEVTPQLIERSLVRVAEGAGRRLGFVAVTPKEDGRVELDLLFVEPDAVRRGLGRLLVEGVIEELSGTGAAWIEVASDPNAAPFYRRLGFAPAGRVPSGSIPGRSLPLLRRLLDLRRCSPPEEALPCTVRNTT